MLGSYTSSVHHYEVCVCACVSVTTFLSIYAVCVCVCVFGGMSHYVSVPAVASSDFFKEESNESMSLFWICCYEIKVLTDTSWQQLRTNKSSSCWIFFCRTNGAVFFLNLKQRHCDIAQAVHTEWGLYYCCESWFRSSSSLKIQSRMNKL